jgi:predicted nucleic acid-binding protein
MDASALAKRYTLEVGTPLINHLFANVTPDRLFVFNVGVAEVVSVLVRKKNAGHISAAACSQAILDLGIEVIHSTSLRKIVADNALMTAALAHIEVHSVNATDALVLRSALNLVALLRATGNDLVLVASDQRLLRAAQIEGLVTFDPETQSQTDLDALLVP